MAQAKIKDTCMVCGKPLSPGVAVYISKVNLTKEALPSDYTLQHVVGLGYRRLPADMTGKLRIQYLGSSNPRGAIHIECWQRSVLNQMIK